MVWLSSSFGGGDKTEVVAQGNRHQEKGMVRLKLTGQLRGRMKTRPTKGFLTCREKLVTGKPQHVTQTGRVNSLGAPARMAGSPRGGRPTLNVLRFHALPMGLFINNYLIGEVVGGGKEASLIFLGLINPSHIPGSPLEAETAALGPLQD